MRAGSVAPVSVSLFLGAFMFGLGMQLANGCGSGVLFSFGGGSGRMMIALPFFVIGSVLGSFLLPTALDWGSAGPVAIAGGLSDSLRTLVNLGLIGVGGFGFYSLGRRRGQQLLAAFDTGLCSDCAVMLGGICSFRSSLGGDLWLHPLGRKAGSGFGRAGGLISPSGNGRGQRVH